MKWLSQFFGVDAPSLPIAGTGSVEDIDFYVCELLRVPEYALLCIEVDDRDRFLQFVADSGAYWMDFPLLTPGQREREPTIREFCSSHALYLREQHDSERCMRIDAQLPKDQSTMSEIIRAALRVIISVDDDARLVFRAQGLVGTDEVTDFVHEQTMRISEEQYFSVHRVFKKENKPIRQIGLAAGGIVCLLSSYTLLLGIGLLTLLAISMLEPKLLQLGIKKTYEDNRHLQEELTYGANRESLWVRGRDLDLRTTWRNVKCWEVHGDLLRITPHGMSCVFFSVSRLKESGVYEPVERLLCANAPRYGPR